MNKDRREHPRVQIPLALEYQLKDRQLSQQATLVDLSLGGVAMLTEDPLPAGGLLAFLRLKLGGVNDPNAAEIRAATEIVRCVEQPGVGRATEYLVGAQFLNLDERSYDMLREFVDRCLNEAEDDDPLEARINCEQPIAIQYQRFDDFVNEVATNLSRTGMFIRAKKPPPPGTVLEFSFQLGDDFNLIAGKAEVVWNRSLADGPERPSGMGVKFLELDKVSRRVLDQILEKRLGQDDTSDDLADDSKAAARITKLEQARDALQGELDKIRTQLQSSLEHRDEVRRRLEERLADVEHERDRRRDEQHSLQKQLETAQAELEATLAARGTEQAEVQAALAQLELARAEHQADDAERESAQALIENERESAQALIENERERAQALVESERAAAEAGADETRRELEAARTAVDELRTELEDARGQRVAAEERLASAESAHRELEQQLETALAERESLRERHRAAADQQDEIRQQYESSLAQQQSLREQVEVAEAECEELRQERNSAVAARRTLGEQLEAAEAAQLALRNELEASQAEREGIGSELAAAQADNARSISDCEAQAERIAELEATISQAEGTIESSRGEAETARADAEAATRDAELERRRLAEAQAAIAELEERTRELVGRSRELEEELHAEREGRAEASRQIDDLQTSVSELRDGSEVRLVALREQLAESEERCERRQQRLEAASEQTAVLRDELTQRHEAEIRVLEEQIEQVQADHEDRVHRTEAELETARGLEGELRVELEQAAQQRTELESRLEQQAEREQAIHSEALEAERALREEVDRLESRLAEESDAQIQQLSEAGAEVERRQQELEATLGDLKELREESGRSLEGLERELSETRASESQLREQLESITRKLERESESRAGLAAELDEAAADAERIAEENRELASIPPATGQVERRTGLRRPSALRAAALVGFGLVLGFMASYPYETLLVSADPIMIRPATSFAGSGSTQPTVAPTADALAALTPETEDDALLSATAELANEPAVEPVQPALEETPVRPAPEHAVERWAVAWSEQRVADYLSSYASTFQVPDDLERAVWELQRARRIQSPESIRLTLGKIETVTSGPDTATASFNQSYVAGAYSDRVRKTLELTWEGEAWRIARETSAPLGEPGNN